MNHYETLFILKPTLTQEELDANVDKIKESLTSQEANILALDTIGLRKLAYPVKKNERGVYYVLYYTADGSVIAEFERKLRFNEDVLKFLTIKYRTKKEISKFEMFVARVNGTLSPNEDESSLQVASQEAKEESKLEEATETKESNESSASNSTSTQKVAQEEASSKDEKESTARADDSSNTKEQKEEEATSKA